jgi:hypothetical protein
LHEPLAQGAWTSTLHRQISINHISLKHINHHQERFFLFSFFYSSLLSSPLLSLDKGGGKKDDQLSLLPSRVCGRVRCYCQVSLMFASCTMDHRHSLATSDTTYHSFNNIELFEPASPPRRRKSTSSKASGSSSYSSSSTSLRRKQQSSLPPTATTAVHHHRCSAHSADESERPPTAHQMKRQDSGYESYTSTPRASMSQSRPTPPRRTSTSNVHGHFSSASTSPKARSRPSTRHCVKPYNHHQPQKIVSSLYVVRSPAAQQSPPASTTTAMETVSSYFQFPSPDPLDPVVAVGSSNTSSRQLQHAATEPAHDALHQAPPQTTHYWTSDRTRRLEYAAIDAASRGVKGWIRRNLLPDCFVSQQDQHVAFDDDTGSVRRYRLELEDDIPPSPALAHGDDTSLLPRRRKPWQLWR